GWRICFLGFPRQARRSAGDFSAAALASNAHCQPGRLCSAGGHFGVLRFQRFQGVASLAAFAVRRGGYGIAASLQVAAEGACAAQCAYGTCDPTELSLCMAALPPDRDNALSLHTIKGAVSK